MTSLSFVRHRAPEQILLLLKLPPQPGQGVCFLFEIEFEFILKYTRVLFYENIIVLFFYFNILIYNNIIVFCIIIFF